MQICSPVRLIQQWDLCTDFAGKWAHFTGIWLKIRSDLQSIKYGMHQLCQQYKHSSQGMAAGCDIPTQWWLATLTATFKPWVTLKRQRNTHCNWCSAWCQHLPTATVSMWHNSQCQQISCKGGIHQSALSHGLNALIWHALSIASILQSRHHPLY